jgi:hypothetical protein
MTMRQVTPADGSGSVTIAWDNSSITVPAGTVLDIAPGSALEAAYGTQNLTPLSGTALADDQQGDNGTDNG